MNDEDYAEIREDVRAMVSSAVTLDHLEDWASLHDPHFHVGKSKEGCYCPVATFMGDLFPKPAYGCHSAAANTGLWITSVEEQCSVLLEYVVKDGDMPVHIAVRAIVADVRVACVIDVVDDLCYYPWSPPGPQGRVLGTVDAGMLYAMCRAVRRTYQGDRRRCVSLVRHEFEERVHASD